MLKNDIMKIKTKEEQILERKEILKNLIKFTKHRIDKNRKKYEWKLKPFFRFFIFTSFKNIDESYEQLKSTLFILQESLEELENGR